MDYSETPSFRKSDITSFEFDISLLENLPTPELKLPEIELPDKIDESNKTDPDNDDEGQTIRPDIPRGPATTGGGINLGNPE